MKLIVLIEVKKVNGDYIIGFWVNCIELLFINYRRCSFKIVIVCVNKLVNELIYFLKIIIKCIIKI